MAIARPPGTRSEISWSGWGDPEQATPLPDGLHRLLRDALGVRDGVPAPASLQELELEPVRLPAGVQAELAEIVGAAHARSDQEARARHAGGKSTIDLLELRRHHPLAAPDLVLAPVSHDQVMAVLERCSRRRVAVVPFGGGTSVVGGLRPDTAGFGGTVALDMRRLNALVALDEESRLAVLEPGLRGPEAEALLAARGYTIGHFPQSFQYATLGGFAAARSSGQASAGYGRFDDRVLALRVATPAGTLDLGRAPKSAAGPDLRQLLLGSEGTLGVITSLTVAVSPAPERRCYEGWSVPSFREGAAILRGLVQDGPPATVLRLSDEAETAAGLPRPQEIEPTHPAGNARPAGETHPAGDTGPPTGCLAIIGWEGRADDVERRRAATGELLRRRGAEPVPGAGDTWAAGRYRGPYLRDAMLDAGALVDTLETVAFWSALPGLYSGVSAAVRDCLAGLGTPPVILCHISHAYPAGASLYFTIACAQLDDPVAQWRAAKTAANDAILAAGGSITHHHGVGVDHREAYAQEVGAPAIELLRAVKRTLDPAGILNPGILLPVGGADNRA
jgi:alkyldihydroxyacetonephosphate synthase